MHERAGIFRRIDIHPDPAEFRDDETGEHVKRISHYSQELAKHLGPVAFRELEVPVCGLYGLVGKLSHRYPQRFAIE